MHAINTSNTMLQISSKTTLTNSTPFRSSTSLANTSPSRRRNNHRQCRLITLNNTSPHKPLGQIGISASDQQATWDPEGILPPSAGGGLIARKERERAAKRAQEQKDEGKFRPVPANLLKQHPEGIPAGDGSLYDKKRYAKELAEKFIPVDLDFPGLCIVHFDPPVLTADGFFTPEQCDSMVNAAENSGLLAASKIGAGNITQTVSASAESAIANAYSNRRTSTSLLIDDKVTTAHGDLKKAATTLQAGGQKLLKTTNGPWGKPGKLPKPGQFTYESLQIARYETGQHFLAHEDAFPIPLARQNGFQRRATLLIYLNDVGSGGATAFDLFGMAVKPSKGKALLFFPAFSSNESDPRSLHTAEDAVDTKWVTQQWVACGVGSSSTVSGLLGSTGGRKSDEEYAAAVFEELTKNKNKKKGLGVGGKKGGSGGGFGRS